MVNTYGFPPTEGDLNEIRCVVGGIFVYIGDDALDSVFSIIALPHIRMVFKLDFLLLTLALAFTTVVRGL
jgi:hypothetical protein